MKKKAGRLRRLSIRGQKWEQQKQPCQAREARRSDIVGADVLQVVELQLQLTYPHVLGGQLLLQPPQLVLLPEEHPEELQGRGKKTAEYTEADNNPRH